LRDCQDCTARSSILPIAPLPSHLSILTGNGIATSSAWRVAASDSDSTLVAATSDAQPKQTSASSSSGRIVCRLIFCCSTNRTRSSARQRATARRELKRRCSKAEHEDCAQSKQRLGASKSLGTGEPRRGAEIRLLRSHSTMGIQGCHCDYKVIAEE